MTEIRPSAQDQALGPKWRGLLGSGLPTLIIAAIVCTRAAVDPDLWGHLRFGLDLLDSRHLPAVDPYSFTHDLPWINHEWLSELLFAAAYRVSGMPGVLLLKALVIAAAVGVLARRTATAAEPYRWRLLAAGILCVGPAVVTLRPQIWTILGVVLLCHLLSDRRRIVWLPLLFGIWANLHGGWIVGVGVAALYLTGRVIDTRDVRDVGLSATMVLGGLLATLINPYGWRLWTFLLATVGVSREVEEWRPLWEQGNAVGFVFLWAIVAAGIVGTSVLRRRARITWAAALPVSSLGLGSLFVARLLPLFSVVATFHAARAWSASEANALARPPTLSQTDRGIRVAIVVVICLANLGGSFRCVPIEGWWTPDLAAASALDASTVTGRLVLPFNWGEFAIWHWGPRLRVSIDGRRETLYSAQTLEAQNEVATGQPAGLDSLSREQPEYVWMPSNAASQTRAWLVDHGYRIDVDTGASFIARRPDLPRLSIGAPLRGCAP